jgi:NADH-quinone oxidoreductase subunit M
MNSFPLLSAAIWIPILAGAGLLVFGSDRYQHAVRIAALIAAIAGFLVTLPLFAGFDTATADFQVVEELPWIDVLGAT